MGNLLGSDVRGDAAGAGLPRSLEEPTAANGGLPLLIGLGGRPCVCVGGGSVAARRVPTLVAAGAQVTVVAPTLHQALTARVDGGSVRHVARAFQPGDTLGAFLVIAATSDRAVNREVAREVLDGGGLVTVASEPSLGNCRFMSVIHRGTLAVAIHTGGASPLVSSAIRLRIEATLPGGLEDVLEQMAAARAELKNRVPDPIERGRLWNAVAESRQLERALSAEPGDSVAQIRMILGLD